MATVKNAEARRQETREEKRMRLRDPAAEAIQARHREDVANSLPARRLREQARAQAIDNLKQEVEARLKDIRRTALVGDTNAQSRASYDRCHALLKAAALRLAEATGQDVPIPPRKPPPALADEPVELVTPPKPSTESIPTTMKDRGSPLTRLPVFGSQLDAQLRQAEILK